MVVNVRGGTGTQILEMLGWIGHCLKHGQRIDRVLINSTRDDIAGNRTDWISQILALPYPIQHATGHSKYRVWEPSKFRQLVGMRGAILPPLKVAPIKSGKILFIRAKESSPVDTTRYYNSAFEGYEVLGDSPEICEDVAKLIKGRNVSQDPVTNWRKCLGAEEIAGPASTFLVSILFFEASKKVRLFKDQDGRVPFPIPQMQLLEEYAGGAFPNLTWI